MVTKQRKIEEEIREKRHFLMQVEIDIPMRSLLHTNQTIPQNLVDYRQELLDMTNNLTGIDLDENGQLTGITWPTKPE